MNYAGSQDFTDTIFCDMSPNVERIFLEILSRRKYETQWDFEVFKRSWVGIYRKQ